MAVHDALGLFEQVDPLLWLVTARAATRSGGLIATFVNHASLIPDVPRVIVAVAKHHHTWTLIEESNAFALHLLGEQNLELVWRFGLKSGWELDKFEGLPTTPGTTGSPLIRNALGVMDCRVEDRMDIGDRTVYVAEVALAERQSQDVPLTLKRLLERATIDQMRELDSLRHRDIATDRTAILAWRQQVNQRHKT